MTNDQKKGPKPERFPWGRIVDVHVVGTYALLEYQSSRPGNAERGWKSARMFSGYLHQPDSERADARGWMDIGQSFRSLDAGLVGCIAYASEGCNAQAARYFMKMIAAAPDEQTPPEKLSIEDAVGVSSAELQKAINELAAQGQGTALDGPAAILLRLRDRINGEK